MIISRVFSGFEQYAVLCERVANPAIDSTAQLQVTPTNDPVLQLAVGLTALCMI